MIRFGLPLALFVVVVGFLAIGLQRDPSVIPSALLGQSAPAFSLSDLHEPERALGLDDLRGEAALLNVWATWCVACRAEHELLMDLAARGVRIFGVNYKDDRTQALSWLERLGDPYVTSVFDPAGTLALDLGVYGAPETFVLDANGVIAYKHIGPLTGQVWAETIEPMMSSLKVGR